jgi:hypothetical protein
MEWNPIVLDRLVAPKCSELTACLAPELTEPYDYFTDFFLNNVVLFIDNPNHDDNTRWPTIVFLRRLTNAAQAYRDARDRMLKCVCAPRHSSEMVRAYLEALSYIESAIVNAYLALMAHEVVGKLINPAAAPRSFDSKDGSPAQRLNAAYNAMKHFHGNLEEGKITDRAPIWLVNDGVECLGSEGQAKLRFAEFVGLLRELECDACFLAKEVFRMAREPGICP